MTQHDDGLVGRLTLPATVPGAVVIGPIVVVLTVVLVVLHVIGDEITHGEAVMGSDEVDARDRLTVEVRGSAQPGGEFLNPADGTAPEIADVVAEAVVPLAPMRAPSAYLVTVGAQIPRLGDVLDLVEDRIIDEGLLEGMVLVNPVGLVTDEGGRQVVAETVNTHLGDPVPQRVEDQAEDFRMGGVY